MFSQWLHCLAGGLRVGYQLRSGVAVACRRFAPYDRCFFLAVNIFLLLGSDISFESLCVIDRVDAVRCNIASRPATHPARLSDCPVVSLLRSICLS